MAWIYDWVCLLFSGCKGYSITEPGVVVGGRRGIHPRVLCLGQSTLKALREGLKPTTPAAPNAWQYIANALTDCAMAPSRSTIPQHCLLTIATRCKTAYAFGLLALHGPILGPLIVSFSCLSMLSHVFSWVCQKRSTAKRYSPKGARSWDNQPCKQASNPQLLRRQSPIS